eukprot:CAMPEP_0195538376 /NCGR_PEP_ID=MMETSP0794_2-20130614/49491_1 /TAXON_ID=515487 /ORGANISM="Stephanopyxis turris, Strain CCMP 815" /LENGTH=1515 /DNA_ID=CAMNT_0040672349 /DNA_START=170 /DNA_END=4717 /DNA_ORIENTATION=+
MGHFAAPLIFAVALGSISFLSTFVDAFGCHCSFLTKVECYGCNNGCIWDRVLLACNSATSTGTDVYTKWNGFIELGQTHVVKATGEVRHAPKVIAERETELLFTPTEFATPTSAPTPHPTASIVHEWGLEHFGFLEVELANTSDTWALGYPSDSAKLIEPGSEYYISNDNPEVNINFDLQSGRLIQGVYLKSWYVTRIGTIEVGVHADDGDDLDGEPGNLHTIPSINSGGWTWFSDIGLSGSYNKEGTLHIPKINARYVQIRLRGGNSDYGGKWGLRHIQISGNPDGLLPDTNSTNTEDGFVNSVGYIPTNNATDIRVAAYSNSGSLLGVLDMRSPVDQRPLLEQSLTTATLAPYSTSAWSTTLPWNWIKEGTKLLVGKSFPNTNEMIVHSLTLEGLAHWGLHTLTRTKFAIFGTASEFSELNMFTHGSKKLAAGMFNMIPASELRWVDELWHVPYLVVRTSIGPRLVHSEAERRRVLVDAGDEPDNEPRWEVLKQHFAHRHRNAHTGRGLSETVRNCCGSNPYAAGTSIFMGWAISRNDTDDGSWRWEDMGTWGAWAAAGWTGWTGMRPGSECGNTLAHELGHSQTMSHFTSGSAVKWGIDDEYPLDGTNMETHPWGYDTTSRRFRTWYKHNDITTGKRDPMNGGEKSNTEACFPQYTGYHAAKSQTWALSSPVLLSAGMGKNVETDGAYYYSSASRQYEKITQDNIVAQVGNTAFLPIEVGVPVVTLIGTIGDTRFDGTSQIYPPIRSTHGNTFQLPNPLDSRLSLEFTGAAYCVNVVYENGYVDQGLIAVPDMTNSTDLRFFSLTVPASGPHKPFEINLYRYDTDSYPNLNEASSKSLLYSRSIDLPTDNPMDGVATTVRVGRGWLGDSDISIDKQCTESVNCLERASTLHWRDEEGPSLTFYATSGGIVTGSTTEGTIFEITVERKEDGEPYTAMFVGSRFLGEHGTSVPILHTISGSNPDWTHGVRFWAPYELNSDLREGSYRTSASSNKLKIEARLPDGSLYGSFTVSIEFSTWPTAPPTQAPTTWGGLEQLGTFDVTLANASDNWASGYPNKPKANIIQSGSEYYIHNDNPDVNINFDLELNREVQAVFLQSWYVTVIPALEACIHADDGEPLLIGAPTSLPHVSSLGWQCLSFDPIPGCCNKERHVDFINAPARYIQIRLRGGRSSYNNRWGLRQVAIRGIDDWHPTASPSVSPSVKPSLGPSSVPSSSPSTSSPTKQPSNVPSAWPSVSPSTEPSALPTTLYPTKYPSHSPSASLTRSLNPTVMPTQAPTTWGGLEQLGTFDVTLANASDNWASGYPNKPKANIIQSGSEYYIHNDNPDVNINFDLELNREVQAVFLQSWYVTVIPALEACIHADDGEPLLIGAPTSLPHVSSLGWQCLSFDPIPGCCNKERHVDFINAPARYIQIRLRGGRSSYNNRWGLRQVAIRGIDDWHPTASPSVSPSVKPSLGPSSVPSSSPSTSSPTKQPSNVPSASLTRSLNPTVMPTQAPTTWGGLEQLGTFDELQQ